MDTIRTPQGRFGFDCDFDAEQGGWVCEVCNRAGETIHATGCFKDKAGALLAGQDWLSKHLAGDIAQAAEQIEEQVREPLAEDATEEGQSGEQ